MNLLSLKRELEQLKAFARNRVGSGCVFEYVEITEYETPTSAQEEVLNQNRECYERNHNRNAHMGFSSITVPSAQVPILLH
jgi:hypothetical protein